MCVIFSFTSFNIFDDTVTEVLNGLGIAVFFLAAHITASLRLLCACVTTLPIFCDQGPRVLAKCIAGNI